MINGSLSALLKLTALLFRLSVFEHPLQSKIRHLSPKKKLNSRGRKARPSDDTPTW